MNILIDDKNTANTNSNTFTHPIRSLSSRTLIRQKLKQMIFANNSESISSNEDGEGKDTITIVARSQAMSSDNNNNTDTKSTHHESTTNIKWLASLELELVGYEDKIMNSSLSSSPTSVVDSAANRLIPSDDVLNPSLQKNDIKNGSTWNDTGALAEQETQYLNLSSGNNSSRGGISRSVSFAESVVTNVRETPRYKREDVPKMFYSKQDIQRFKYNIRNGIVEDYAELMCTESESSSVSSTCYYCLCIDVLHFCGQK